MSRDSSVRARVVPDPALELRVFVLAREHRVLDLVRRAAPSAVEVFGASDPASLGLELSAHPVPCAIVIDMSVAEPRLRKLLGLLRQRWAGVPRIALLNASSVGALEAANIHTRHLLFKHAPKVQREQQLALFLRAALDERLHWIASRLEFARNNGLAGAVLETFVAFSILQLHRNELCDYFGLEERGVQKRVRRLCESLGIEQRRLDHVAQLVATIPASRASGAAVRALEDRAIAHRAEEVARLG